MLTLWLNAISSDTQPCRQINIFNPHYQPIMVELQHLLDSRLPLLVAGVVFLTVQDSI